MLVNVFFFLEDSYLGPSSRHVGGRVFMTRWQKNIAESWQQWRAFSNSDGCSQHGGGTEFTRMWGLCADAWHTEDPQGSLRVSKNSFLIFFLDLVDKTAHFLYICCDLVYRMLWPLSMWHTFVYLLVGCTLISSAVNLHANQRKNCFVVKFAVPSIPYPDPKHWCYRLWYSESGSVTLMFPSLM
jgi:hypothetical protein